MTQTVNGHGAAVATPGPGPTDGEHRLGRGVYEGPAALGEARRALRVALPEPSSKFDQDDEWCVVAQPDGSWREYRFHDYHHIFEVPGLYEKIFYDVLGCDSPRFMAGLLADALADAREDAADIRALDLGAGNGIMAEELAHVGVAHAVGVDILPEARAAAERDRPGLYADYLVEDLTALDPQQARRLDDHRLNALTVVAALGFGDIPPAAFRTAYDHIAQDGWVVLTIKDAFLAAEDTTGFATMISEGMASGALEVVRRERFRHRLATDASPLVYEGIVARKRGPLG
ncbi:class I SAM-dependent methyltransferase [Actinomycetospora sp. TBRC 11914]|uniref:methyltransferase domain-containing protein n=1 Tax=Actinomycetospora sp. TBRC 11914 TaxID=2729387 RepID=UPI00145CC345|nr:class I SAM-dependent methyltransferase [Actinomycetospora sp. TBRC 11914]NMO90144.1 class I SAM-dependent methyltransferase [Actinomycetospora sp. TBRC 11914]